MTHYYAQINAARIVVAVSQLVGSVDASDMIPIDRYDASLIGKRHDAESGDFVEVSVDPVPSVRHISVGAFFDRFGPLKWAILADTNPQVQAVVKDASVRSYIDLDNADLPAGLALLQAAGHAINAEAVVGAPIRPEELP